MTIAFRKQCWHWKQEVRDKPKIKGQLINTWIGMNVENLEEWEKNARKDVRTKLYRMLKVYKQTKRALLRIAIKSSWKAKKEPK